MAEPATTNSFFTLQSMMTLGGVTGATFVVANGIQRAFNYNPRWLALAIAQAICLGMVFKSGGIGSDYLIGVINGFLVYCSAAGATGVAGSTTTDGAVVASARAGNVTTGGRTVPDDRAARRFLSAWF